MKISRASFLDRWARVSAIARSVGDALRGLALGSSGSPEPLPRYRVGAGRDEAALEAALRAHGVRHLALPAIDENLPAPYRGLIAADAGTPLVAALSEMPDSNTWLSQLSWPAFLEWLPWAMGARRPAVEIRPIPSADPRLGSGLFAAQDISRGTLVGIYTGVALCTEGWSHDETRYCMAPPDFRRPNAQRRLANHSAIDARTAGNETRFLNHSYAPNLDLIHCKVAGLWVPVFFANRDIPAGTQLTIDYGKDYWEQRKIEPLPL